jgi:hypothetical protein
MAPIVGRLPGGRDGAIAQLGERVVRNDEVGGSIPPGSTSLRWLRQLRLGRPGTLSRSEVSEGCRAEARLVSPKLAERRRKGEAGPGQAFHSYFPVNLGGRFSMKLATPSRKSLPLSAITISRFASMVASASVWNGTS